jgi:replication-associated recombination protein RarA
LANARHKAKCNAEIALKKPLKKYEFWETLSALQKEIRRGNVEDALFWAIQGERNGPVSLWNRLTTIASEDVGPANMMLPMVIYALRKSYFRAIDRKNGAYRLFLTHAVLLLTTIPKSRIVDDLCNAMYGEIIFDHKEKEVPKYAFDRHITTSPDEQKTWDFFYDESTKLADESTGPYKNIWTNRAKRIHLTYDELPTDNSLYNACNEKRKKVKKGKKDKIQFAVERSGDLSKLL